MCTRYSKTKMEKHWSSEVHLVQDQHELKAKLWFTKERSVLPMFRVLDVFLAAPLGHTFVHFSRVR